MGAGCCGTWTSTRTLPIRTDGAVSAGRTAAGGRAGDGVGPAGSGTVRGAA